MRRPRLPVTLLLSVCAAPWPPVCLPVAALAAEAREAPPAPPRGPARDTVVVARPPAHTSGHTRAAAGGLTGQVVDAATGEVLAGALVVLVLRPDGVITPAGAGAAAFPATARQTQTDASGRYQFGALAPGAYRIRASRLGYAPATADVTVADAAPEVSLGLAVAPLALRPVEVRATGPAAPRLLAGPRPGAADPDAAAALNALAARRRTYLTTDAREVTRADVTTAATLAESDLFRALHRLPGVSTRDEWSAELWTRGARPDLTRVTLDGMPLFSPVALSGILSAVNTDAVGSATLLPGVRPASVGEGGAAVLDLRTRAGGRLGGRATSGVGGVAEVGLLSGRLALDGAAADGGAAWSVSGRRSYADAVGRLVDRSLRLPNFGDVTARGDLRLSPTQTLTASGLLQHTFAPVNGSGFASASGNQGVVYGNRVLRLTHAALVAGPLGRLRVTHTVGASAYAHDGSGPFRVYPSPAAPVTPADSSRAAFDAAVARVGQPAIRASTVLLRGEIAPAPRAAPEAPDAAAPPWGLGYELARQRASYAGPGRRYFLGGDYAFLPADSLAPLSFLARDSLRVGGALTVGALWATRRYRPTERLEVEPGLRLELAGGAGAPAAFRPAPRLAARYTLDPDTRLSAAAGRSVQYTQALSPNTITRDRQFYPGSLWLIAGRDAPALVTDQATVGAERWLGGGWLGSVNAYARRTTGFATFDPRPGPLGDRAPYVIGREHGRGIEFAARRLVGRTTATFAYSWSRSTVDAGGFTYASPQDRPHVFDATVSQRLGARWRLGGALSAATGSPYTRTASSVFLPDSVPVDSYSGSALATGGGQVRDVPNARRNPAFFDAGLVAEWSRPVRAWQLSAYAQVQSPLATYTSDAYRGDGACYVAPGSAPAAAFAPGARCRGGPRHQTTTPVIPTVGLRLAF